MAETRQRRDVRRGHELCAQHIPLSLTDIWSQEATLTEAIGWTGVHYASMDRTDSGRGRRIDQREAPGRCSPLRPSPRGHFASGEIEVGSP